MPELAVSWLEQYEMVLVIVAGVFYFCMNALFAYTLQAISDKTDAAPAWMSWVPFVQMHPLIRASGSTWTGLLIWIVAAVVVVGLGAVAASHDFQGPAFLAVLALMVGSLIYFGGMLWRLAVNREVSGFVGLACLIPLFGLPFYFYIAFHDGPVRPSEIGLAVALALSILSAASLRSDLSEFREVIESGMVPFESEGSEESEEIQKILKEMQAQMEKSAGDERSASSAAAVVGVASLGPESARRIYYQFVDERGSVHFVERLDQVPAKWRDRVGYVDMEAPPPATPDEARRTRERRNAGAVGGTVLASGSRSPDVLFYWADWCGYCKKTRAELDRRSVAYDLRDIDNPAALAELVEKTGQRGIPVLDIDGKILIGYDPAGMDQLLGQAL